MREKFKSVELQRHSAAVTQKAQRCEGVEAQDHRDLKGRTGESENAECENAECENARKRENLPAQRSESMSTQRRNDSEKRRYLSVKAHEGESADAQKLHCMSVRDCRGAEAQRPRVVECRGAIGRNDVWSRQWRLADVGARRVVSAERWVYMIGEAQNRDGVDRHNCEGSKVYKNGVEVRKGGDRQLRKCGSAEALWGSWWIVQRCWDISALRRGGTDAQERGRVETRKKGGVEAQAGQKIGWMFCNMASERKFAWAILCEYERTIIRNVNCLGTL